MDKLIFFILGIIFGINLLIVICSVIVGAEADKKLNKFEDR